MVVDVGVTGWRRPIGRLFVIGHLLHMSFTQKDPITNGSFAESDLQLKASYAPPPSCCTNFSVAKMP